MKDILYAGLLWILTGIGVASFISIYMKQHENDQQSNYLREGATIGACFGIVLSILRIVDYSLSVGIGLLFGSLIGFSIKKPK